MNWIEYAKEKPEVEPKREILVQFDNGHNMVCYSTEGSYPRTLIKWAEIEPPGELDTISPQAKSEPPTPDPFEEWFRTVGVFIFDNPNGKYALARAAYDKGWDAAIRYKEKQ